MAAVQVREKELDAGRELSQTSGTVPPQTMADLSETVTLASMKDSKQSSLHERKICLGRFQMRDGPVTKSKESHDYVRDHFTRIQ